MPLSFVDLQRYDASYRRNAICLDWFNRKQPGLSQRVRPEVAGPMTGSASSGVSRAGMQTRISLRSIWQAIFSDHAPATLTYPGMVAFGGKPDIAVLGGHVG
jgi:hypothetical protein